MKAQNKCLFEKRSQCLYLSHVSKLIKSHSGDEQYTDSYYICGMTGKRINKRHCTTCNMYKKLIYILIFLMSFAFHAQAQTHRYNSVMFSISPVDMGIGLRYDRMLTRHFGTYCYAGRGNYLIDKDSYCRHHAKYSLGVVFCDKESIFSLGLNYHTFRDYQNMNKKALAPFSCDIGFGGKLKRFVMIIRFDFIKFESNLDIGFNF